MKSVCTLGAGSALQSIHYRGVIGVALRAIGAERLRVGRVERDVAGEPAGGSAAGLAALHPQGHRVSAAGECRRLDFAQLAERVSDAKKRGLYSQAGEEGSIPFTRSNLLICTGGL